MDKKLRKLGFQEKDFHTGDITLNYVEGPANGKPALVFIHGQTMTWEEYVLIMPLLVSDFRVYAVTVRGHGKSSKTPGQYTFVNMGADMVAFLGEVVREPAVVVGNSSGGVLTAWLAAYAPPGLVRAIVLEDPPLFRCDAEHIKGTWVYDMFVALADAAAKPDSDDKGEGFASFFRNSLAPKMREQQQKQQTAGGSGENQDPIAGRPPPKAALWAVGQLITFKQALHPGRAVDLAFLPAQPRVVLRCMSQFDGNFSRAFVEGTAGAGFDHAEALARIEVPVLFLHARYAMREGRLAGALSNEDVERVRGLVKGPWRYVNMECGHAIALDAPEREAEEIKTWASENGITGTAK